MQMLDCVCGVVVFGDICVCKKRCLTGSALAITCMLYRLTSRLRILVARRLLLLLIHNQTHNSHTPRHTHLQIAHFVEQVPVLLAQPAGAGGAVVGAEPGSSGVVLCASSFTCRSKEGWAAAGCAC